MKVLHIQVFLLIIGAVFAFNQVPLTMAEDMLTQINLNPYGSSSPVNLTAADGDVYFAAYDSYSSNYLLWKSNGTKAGTGIVSNEPKLSWGSYLNSQKYKMHYSNGQLLFSGNTTEKGMELYRSDGTAAGTVLLKDIADRPNLYGYVQSSNPHAFTAVNNVIYFIARSGTGVSGGDSLWKTDGTESETVMVKDINPTCLTGNQFFLLFNGNGELWQSIGSETGTAMVKDIKLYGNSDPEDLITIGNTTFFTAEEDATGRELWKTDGTTAGTVMVADLNLEGSTDFGEFIENNGILYFTINDGDQLWRSDGTADGTRMIIETYSVGNSDIHDLAVLNNVLYFRAMNGATWDLWKTDGTTAGTVQVTQPAVDGFGLHPTDIMSCNERLFFLGFNSSWGMELYESDGTAAGTRCVQDIRIGVENSNVQNMTCVENKLFFSADNGRNGQELWVYTMDYCLAVGDDLGIHVPCAEYNGSSYGFMLDFYHNPNDPTGLYWKLAETSLTAGTGSNCIPIATDLSMTMDCVSYNGTKYAFTLRFYSNPHATGLYWKMDLSTLVIK